MMVSTWESSECEQRCAALNYLDLDEDKFKLDNLSILFRLQHERLPDLLTISRCVSVVYSMESRVAVPDNIVVERVVQSCSYNARSYIIFEIADALQILFEP